MKEKVSKIVKYAISLILAFVFLYFSFRGVNWKDFMVGLASCGWEYVLLSMAAGVMAFFFRALRWRELILPIDKSMNKLTSFDAINIGNLVNLVLPRVGEFVRCAVITKNSKKASYDKTLGTVVMERATDVLTLVFLVVLLSILMWKKFGSFFVKDMLGPASQGLNFSIWWIVLGLVAVGTLIVWLIVHFKEKSRFCLKICDFFSGVGRGITSCFKMKHAWRFFFYNAMVWTMYWLMSYGIVLAVQATDMSQVSADMARSIEMFTALNGADALFLMLAGALSSLVPVPGGFGAFHYIVGLAISTVYGVPFEIGIMFATLSHESQIITQAAFGGISYGIEAIRNN